MCERASECVCMCVCVSGANQLVTIRRYKSLEIALTALSRSDEYWYDSVGGVARYT